MSKEMRVRALYVVVLVGLVLFLVSPFFIPLALAGTVALTLRPLHTRLVDKGLSHGTSSLILTSLFGVIISIPLFFFVIKGTIALTTKLEELSINEKLREQGVQELVKDIRHDFIVGIKKFSGQYEFLDFLNERKIDQYLGVVITYLLNFFRTFLANLPTLFILLIIMIICTYSFLKHAPAIKRFFQELLGFDESRMKRLTSAMIKGSRAVYLSNIITGGIQSLIIAGAVSLLHIGEFFLVFFVTLILSFIPVIGAAPVGFVFALWSFIIGNMTAAIVLVCVASFTGVIDNILRPWLATFGESRITAVPAFICVIGGALWLGFPGLFIGLLLGSFAFDTLPIFWEELRPEKRSDHF